MNNPKRIISKPEQLPIPDSVSEILANDDIRRMIADFQNEDIAECDGLIILWKTKGGSILIRTNLDDLSCFGLFWMGINARSVDDAE